MPSLLWKDRRAYWVEAARVADQALADLDPPQRELVHERWLKQTRSYDLGWRRLRGAHYLLRVPTIAGAATVPVLASLGAPKVATALVGLVVAVLASLDTFFQFGLRWLQKRRAAAAMESEGWEFIELSGAYQENAAHGAAFKLFLGRIEALNSELSTKYMDAFNDDGKGLRENVVPTTAK